MAEVIHPEEIISPVEVGELLPEVMKLKKDGFRHRHVPQPLITSLS